MNFAYSLDAQGDVQKREVTADELSAAREAALAKLNADTAGWAMRSCWNCNAAHNHFLADTKDGFLFRCVMGCGRWYYNGIDITEDGDSAEEED